MARSTHSTTITEVGSIGSWLVALGLLTMSVSQPVLVDSDAVKLFKHSDETDRDYKSGKRGGVN